MVYELKYEKAPEAITDTYKEFEISVHQRAKRRRLRPDGNRFILQPAQPPVQSVFETFCQN